MNFSILVVDDDEGVRELLKHALQMSGYEVLLAGNVHGGFGMAQQAAPGMALVDWNLGADSGLSLVRMMRAHPATKHIPIMMVTCRDLEQDKVLALEAGADDYLTKPFSPREMVARIHAIRRRIASSEQGAPITLGPLRIDPSCHRVTVANQPLELRTKEFQLLHFLATSPGRIYTRSQLLDMVWGSHTVMGERTVDAYVQRLRLALDGFGHGLMIETIRGVGYRIIDTTYA